MSQLHTTPASLAAALRRAADDVANLGDIQLSPVLLQLNLQAVSHRGTFDERKQTVDILAAALAVPDAKTETGEGKGALYRLACFTPRAGGDDTRLTIFTAVEDLRTGGAA